jgi:ethanolamine utilization protein EutN
MRLASVIGRVTLSERHPSLKGERLLLVLPWGPTTAATGGGHDFSIVAYDQLGAGLGQTVGICESAEATRPFQKPTPVDAYCAALIDDVFYQAADPRAV